MPEYNIKLNGMWISEIRYDAADIQLIGSDVQQDAEIFEGLASVIKAMGDIKDYDVANKIFIYEVIIEKAVI